MNPRVEALLERLRRIELTPRQRKLAVWIGYPLFALVVALMTFSTSVPPERIKDRLESALSADVSSGQPMAIGMDVTIGELSLSLLTGAGFNANDIVLRTRPIDPNAKPARYVIDDLKVRLGLFSTMFGRPSYSFKGHALSGVASGKVSGNADGTKLDIELEKLVLNGVPGLQQSVGLPIEGTVSGKMDVDVPKNSVALAEGSIEIDIDQAAVGDGKAKLTVPNDPFLAAGLTFPRISLGHITGKIAIDKGRAKLENVRIHSTDGDATIDGYVELRDPIGMSQVHAYLKFRPSDALTKREPTIELVNNALGATAKRPDGYLGFQLTGSLMGVYFLPSKEPPFGVTTRSEPTATTPPPTATPTAPALPTAPMPTPPTLPNVPPPPPSPPPGTGGGAGGSGGAGGGGEPPPPVGGSATVPAPSPAPPVQGPPPGETQQVAPPPPGRRPHDENVDRTNTE